MPIEIVVPRLGWSMDEGTFVEWLKKNGETVNAGDMLFVMEGEKAAEEIESFDAGILHVPADAPQSGDTVAVGQILGFLLAEGETPPEKIPVQHLGPVTTGDQDPPTQSTSRAAGPAARRLARELGVDLDKVPTPDPTGRVIPDDISRSNKSRRQPTARDTASAASDRVIASPRARRVARELGIHWQSLSGTGRNGRIRERDVVAAAQQTENFSNRRTVPLPSVPGTLHEPAKIRQTIAQRMQASIQETAPVTLHTKVNAAELVSWREQVKANSAEIVPGYQDLLIKLVASSLRQFPLLNACWINDAIYVYDEINVAIAVDTEHGLVAPVIRNVEEMSILQVAEKSRELADLAQTSKLSSEQLSGGTFTLSNLGMFDVDHFTPIINLPQSAILGVGRIVDEPIVEEGKIVPGKTLSLSLTFDHRVLDGAPAAHWLQDVANRIRAPHSEPAHV